jgi:hypothetical protein
MMNHWSAALCNSRCRHQMPSVLSITKHCSSLQSLLSASQEEFKAISVASRQELDGLLRNMTCGLAPPGLPGQVSEPQDFLIRQIGFDNGGNLVVGDMVKPGQQLKFMVGELMLVTNACDDVMMLAPMLAHVMASVAQRKR